MPQNNNPQDAEARIDDRDAALEEATEEREEHAVVEEADANLKGTPSMPEFDLYINPKDPALGLYVRTGAHLPDLADAKQWVFDGARPGDELSAELVQQIQADGYAFQRLA